MNFTLNTPDLTIEATTAKEVAEICEHFRLDITQRTDELIVGHMTHVVSGAKRPWFHLFADVGFEFLQPYYDLLAKVTGYTGPAFEIAAPRYPGGYCVNLCHTHIVANATIDATGYHAEGFIRAEDWNGETAAARAPRNFAEYLRAGLGATKSEPQYIRLGNNMLKENPNYGRTRHAPHPACTSVRLFEAIFEHWRAHHATAAQRELWAQGEACYRTVVKTDSLAAAMLLHGYSTINLDNYTRQITLDEFKAAGKEAA